MPGGIIRRLTEPHFDPIEAFLSLSTKYNFKDKGINRREVKLFKKPN